MEADVTELRNLNYTLITSDLNSKVKELEHERDSLVTAMKLQQQEFEQRHYKRGNDQAILKFKSNIKSNNRYRELNDEANTHNGDLHASVIEIDSNTQQPKFGQNTAINKSIAMVITQEIT